MEQQAQELIGFLNSNRKDVQWTAVDFIAGLTGSPEGLDVLRLHADDLLPPLFRVAVSQEKTAEKLAITSLVNLSQDQSVAQKMQSLNAVNLTMDLIRDSDDQQHHDLLVMLLSNLTVEEEGARKLLQLDNERLQGLNLQILLKFFMGEIQDKQNDKYEHISNIFTNVTRIEEGRKILLKSGTGFFQSMVKQLQSQNDIRRRGCAATIRNCCFTAEDDGTLEEIISDSQTLQELLVPINGREPKEEDESVRESIAEAVMMLCEIDAGVDALWKVGAADTLKKGYEFEENQNVCRAMERCANIFISGGQVVDINNNNLQHTIITEEQT
eukprot:TRINITY_DN2490_c0_g1_i2.p1 TRINITY_DN2490_c0_g1~~TRINITY_DN2490_c0_g1_i2.p1  ORF type:complete len:344 (-),score=55.60 TRINITY_DN2490_c0_g1_i2:55-1035(-)